MITITGTLFDLLGYLTFVAIYITVLITWRAHKKELWIIACETRRKEKLHYDWLVKIGLEEAAYYFNNEGLQTVTLWELWEHSIWK
ncbi:hypothetical protein LCGC14_2410840 [marine sediment metagenome]|uniref:Uncharacterized protein n=1 Tax=marine sediment metagenome TaxID=412755 RepID=A0A0F9CEQ4_9ZZZZ